ncbi:MSMEG_0568 family radical SAM protein [bacterium M00.F.Ca.ET.228.01.1.1]|uniref:MSMEG_0568 family radical SAM protein n=1 Tax=Paraburkholderia phenoliruptrix TaxID=252970 RepID=UPI0010930AB1|nr:MSMEG_0568 family radical SAM protein [Paraburkholderia phenoliruptrix]MBW9130563.1 MSMEG_0568 family radical SAM protein [Paraburkholderia ginsengiterrae]TGP39815.1 MSMEG_0568 family radical SAM protein [bacterium M00.F.Ca.ET.228.01.1.1]TGR95676.1 MSMEG_0568 family radical SAM protein [bacterium M00.F.Ca.ET.191.01.1.1]TGT96692.1 MSMEG_0568 family radical SAM protein [bacterium M00.F.Ca.ET.155.01.1.1]MBW0448082.1 MSMEG_0568 family radical SAM protein [Paraburkholderia phenoliruptrix]
MNANMSLSPAEPRTQRQMTELRTELQSVGLRLVDPNAGAASRRGGAGPSDHKAVTVDGVTIMVPVHTSSAWNSPFIAGAPDESGASALLRGTIPIASISFPNAPRFTKLQTLDGVPYSHIATLHSTDVLATTVLQTCIRYESRKKTCKFCAIGQSLAAGRTIARKTPEQLAEVARAAVLLDGVKHMVLTTGTPPTPDRGAQILCESAFAIKAAVDLPIQAQCEPPDNDAWFERMKASGIDTLGMHLEVVTPEVRARVMPGKASVPVSRYMEAFKAAVGVFGKGQVSTYILAGLGDTAEAILSISRELIDMGVYPFVVPFVPISGTPLEDHPPPSHAFMKSILEPLGAMLRDAQMRSADIKAGCGKCGACSSLASYEA